MDDRRLNKLEEKLDKMSDSISSIDKTLSTQSIQLTEHIKRTNLLEDRFKPVEDHVQSLKGIVLFFKVLASIATVAEVIRLFIK